MGKRILAAEALVRVKGVTDLGGRALECANANELDKGVQ